MMSSYTPQNEELRISTAPSPDNTYKRRSVTNTRTSMYQLSPYDRELKYIAIVKIEKQKQMTV